MDLVFEFLYVVATAAYFSTVWKAFMVSTTFSNKLSTNLWLQDLVCFNMQGLEGTKILLTCQGFDSQASYHMLNFP